VLLVTIDTLRADRLGAYGYAAGETPRLDALAADGVRFDQAISPMPMTLPSHTSLMSSLYPYEHGVRDNADFEIDEGIELLAESFDAAGYDTGAFIAAYVLHSRWGLAPGFDHYDDDGINRIDDVGGAGRAERRGDEVLDVALPWIRQPREAPFFSWVHLYDPHAPYAAPEPWGTRFAHEPYDGEVSYTDTLIGELVDELAAADLLDNTIILVTADHGEDLEDHGEPGHGIFLYDTVMRVPMILRLPDGAAAGTVVEEQVRLIDVGPTLLDLAELSAPDGITGESMSPLLVGGGQPRPAYSETMYPRWHFGWQELYALRADGFKYILAPAPELYDLAADAGERDNLADTRVELADALHEALEALEADVDDSARVDATGEAARRLRALGYIGTAPADLGSGPLPDPKDKIEVYRILVEADSLMSEERYDEAITRYETLIAQDPRIVDAHYQLGTARRMTNDYVAAEAALLDALALRPDYEAALADLGVVHRRLDDPEQARADFDAVLALDPRNTNAHFNLGEMALEDGDPATALRHFDQVIELYDDVVAPRFSAGVASYDMGDYRRAHDEFEFVAATAPDFAAVHYYRALLREAAGDPDGALQLYRTAVQRDPEDFRSLFNMAVILTDGRNDHVNGIAALRAAVAVNPDLERALIYLGRSLVFLADPATYPEAEDSLTRALSLDPPAGLLPMAHLTLAELYRRTGRPAEAQRHQALGQAAGRTSTR
jgi:arylsulfatase A-like enzyme/Tfp pilus assembly protein PilF